VYEEHNIVGSARGEPLPAGCVGIRLRIALSGSPSQRWWRDLSARLTLELTGHAAIGHLRLNEIVQGQEIVLEGVESGEASSIAGAVERAVDATNEACADGRDVTQDENVPRADAEAIADEVQASQRATGAPHSGHQRRNLSGAIHRTGRQWRAGVRLARAPIARAGRSEAVPDRFLPTASPLPVIRASLR
jgi:hypothetical protein